MEETKRNIWPGWNVVKTIGRGGFGEVYEIERNNFGSVEKAALKVISIPQGRNDIEELINDGYDSESITIRFRSYLESIVNEYSLMADLKGHTNIVYCDDLRYIQHDDGIGWDIYIKMELLTPLMKYLPKNITDEHVIQLGMDICNALVLCKNRGIVHRDIKPQNIFVSKDGNYKLGDFGIAKITERTASGTKIGTYKYMAPEVYNNQPYGRGADIYSLGLVMYWMLNERRLPFLPLPPKTPTVSEDDKARERRLSGEQIPFPAHGSRSLQRIVLKACAPGPRERYQSAAEMLEDMMKLTQETAGLFSTWEKDGDEDTVKLRNSFEDETVAESRSSWKAEVAEHRKPDKRSDAQDKTEGLFPGWNNRNHAEQAKDDITLKSEQTKQNEVKREELTGKEKHEEKELLDRLQIRKESNNHDKHKKQIFTLVGIVAVVVMILMCILFFVPKDNHEDGDEMLNAATDEVVLPTQTELVLIDLYNDMVTYCSAMEAERGALAVWKYLKEYAPIDDDPRYQELISSYYVKLASNALFESERCAANGNYMQAIKNIWDVPGYEESNQLMDALKQYFKVFTTHRIAAGRRFTGKINEDGEVLLWGRSEEGWCDTSTWSDVVSLAIGDYYVAGLRANGTLLLAGPKEYYQDAVEWTDISVLAAGDANIVGLKYDGTILADGHSEWGQLNVEGLYGDMPVVSVAAGYRHTVALRADGTVVAVGSNEYGQLEVSTWSDIIAIAAGSEHTVGLRIDGTVLVAGLNKDGQGDTEGWKDIVGISAGDYFTMGLRSDGTVVAVGKNQKGQCATGGWYSIVEIAAGNKQAIGLNAYGELLCAGEQIQ